MERWLKRGVDQTEAARANAEVRGRSNVSLPIFRYAAMRQFGSYLAGSTTGTAKITG